MLLSCKNIRKTLSIALHISTSLGHCNKRGCGQTISSKASKYTCTENVFILYYSCSREQLALLYYYLRRTIVDIHYHRCSLGPKVDARSTGLIGVHHTI